MEFKKSFPWATVVAFVCVTAIVVVALLRDRIVNAPFSQITITAQGKVQVKPDIAVVQLSVTTPRQVTSAEAFDKNAAAMNQVIEAMKKLGVDEKDLQTTGLRLNPAYEYKDGSSRLIGYDAYQELSVRVRDLKKVSEVIARGAGEGINQIGGISFTIDDLEKYKALARAEAVQKAEAKAAEMSGLTGIRLGKLINVFESGGDQSPIAYGEGFSGGPSMMKSMVAPNIQAGSQEVMVEIGLTYRVR